MTRGTDKSGAIAAAPTGPASGLDPLVTNPLRNGKGDLWQRLIVIYAKTAPEAMTKLEQALALGDAATVSLTAHSLKSSSANMGAVRLSDLFNRLETMARNAQLEPAHDLMTEIRGEFRLVSLALASEAERASAATRTTV